MIDGSRPHELIARILKAGLSEEKLSLMPCLRTFSNVLF